MAEQASDIGLAEKAKWDGHIQVRFLGQFQVQVGDVIINDSTSRARQPWNLLQYLMVSRHKPVTRLQLMEALWPEDSSDQPDKALKNLVYRVRSAFSAKGVPFAQELILSRGGNYVLNNDLDWWIDVEQLGEFYRMALDETAPLRHRIDDALAAIELYQGDFLSEQMHEDWVLPLYTHYRSCFFQAARLALKLLAGTGRLADMEFVCNRVISVDPLSEEFHLEYMRILSAEDKKSTALAHYNQMAQMLFRELGIAPNEELRGLYAEISSRVQTTVTDWQSIKQILCEEDAGNDAFYCDFEVFRSLYRLEVRAAQRAEQDMFVALFTLMNEKGGALEGERLDRCMCLLLNIIHQCLRRGDVVSRFSQCQYILLLPTLTVENAERVAGRVVDRFVRGCPYLDLALEMSVQPLDSTLA